MTTAGATLPDRAELKLFGAASLGNSSYCSHKSYVAVTRYTLWPPRSHPLRFLAQWLIGTKFQIECYIPSRKSQLNRCLWAGYRRWISLSQKALTRMPRRRNWAVTTAAMMLRGFPAGGQVCSRVLHGLRASTYPKLRIPLCFHGIESQPQQHPGSPRWSWVA